MGARLSLSRETVFALARAYWAYAALAGIMILAAVVRVYDIVPNPPGFFTDEASFGYNAYTILHSGKDEHGAVMPLLFKSFGEYKLPVYIYSQVPFIGLLGLSELPVRLTTAIYGTLTVFALYLLVRALFHREGLALAAAAVLAILPWHVHYSRTGLGDITVHIFFLVVALYFFVQGTRDRPLYLVGSAIAFVLAIYSYRSAWVITPPLLGVLALLYHRELLKHWRYTLAGAAILVLATLPIGLHLLNVDTDRAQEQSITSLGLSTGETVERFMTQYRSHFTPGFLFDGTAESNPRHVLPGFEWVYPWQVPFMVLGFAAMLWRPSRAKMTVLAMLAVFPLAAAVSSFSPNSNRAFFGAIVVAILTAYGLITLVSFLTHWSRPRAVHMMGLGLAGVVVLGTTITGGVRFASFLDFYHGTYQDLTPGFWGWQWGGRQIIDRFEAVEDDYDLMVMDGAFNAPDMFYSFYAPNGCEKCIIGNWDKYDPAQRQLFALRPDTLAPAFDYDLVDTLSYPSGEIGFVLVEIEGRQTGFAGNMGDIYLDAPARSIGELDQAIEADSQSAQLWLERGLAYLHQGNFEQAQLDFEQALQLDPDLAPAYMSRGQARFVLGDLVGARADLDRAVELDPEFALAHYNRGNVEIAIGRIDHAANAYTRATELDDGLVAAHNNLSNMYALQDQAEAAINELEIAINLDPSSPLLYTNRARAYELRYVIIRDAADLELAQADLTTAIELDSQFAPAYAVRGGVRHRLGDLEGALTDVERAIALDPSLAEAYRNRGIVYTALGEYRRGAADLDRALTLEGDRAMTYATRGLARLGLGDSGPALEDLNKAVLLDRIFVSTPIHGKNPVWSLRGATSLEEDLREAMAGVDDPAVLTELQAVLDYLRADAQ